MLQSFVYKSLSEGDKNKLIQRNTDPNNSIQDSVEKILAEVVARGDEALTDFALQFDKVELEQLYLEKDEIEMLAAGISREQQRALEIAFQNIHRFHSTQLKRERVTETMPGVKCWREVRPIEKVGLYIPGARTDRGM
jgi:histidinol dehydrogenase